jgi:hypothetical protein
MDVRLSNGTDIAYSNQQLGWLGWGSIFSYIEAATTQEIKFVGYMRPDFLIEISESSELEER